MKKTKFKLLFFIVVSIYMFWMGAIFYSSSQTAAEQDIVPQLKHVVSQQKLKQIVGKSEFHYGNKVLSYKQPYVFLEFFIRKAAHVVVYMILTWLGIGVLQFLFSNKTYWYLIASSLSLIYAGLDEWHQTFVHGRTGTYLDVGVDAIGVLLAISTHLVYQKWKKKRI